MRGMRFQASRAEILYASARVGCEVSSRVRATPIRGKASIFFNSSLRPGLGLDVGALMKSRVFDHFSMTRTSMTWRLSPPALGLVEASKGPWVASTLRQAQRPRFDASAGLSAGKLSDHASTLRQGSAQARSATTPRRFGRAQRRQGQRPRFDASAGLSAGKVSHRFVGANLRIQGLATRRQQHETHV